MGFYNITIYDIMSESAIIHVGPLNYTQTNESEQNLITEEFMSELLVDEQYIVEIVVDMQHWCKESNKNKIQYY